MVRCERHKREFGDDGHGGQVIKLTDEWGQDLFYKQCFVRTVAEGLRRPRDWS